MVFESNRGFFDLAWTIVAADGTTAATCPSPDTTGSRSYVIETSLGQRFDCPSYHAVASALPADTYSLDVKLQDVYYNGYVFGTYGTGHVDELTITADAITPVPVTIVLSQ